MADYSTAVSIKGREEAYKGMANVRASSKDLVEKIVSSAKLHGEIKMVEGNSLSIALEKGELTIEFSGRLNSKSVMPGNRVSVSSNIKAIDSGQ